MSERLTPETDALVPQFLNGGKVPDIFAHCRKLEQERDEAMEEIEALRHEYHGAKAMAGGFKDKIKSLTEQRDEAREEAHRFRSLSYARSGIDKSASWFPWETSLNLAQKAQLLATEKHAK